MKQLLIIKTVLAFIGVFFLFTAQGQGMDSSTYKKTLVQFYKRQTTGNKTYTYKPEEHSKLEQGTAFSNALVWRKFNIEYPMVLNYLKIKRGTPEATAKISYLEDPANSKEREQVVAKATEQLVQENKAKTRGKHVAPGLSTSANPGKIENHDDQIKDSVLKNFKF